MNDDGNGPTIAGRTKGDCGLLGKWRGEGQYWVWLDVRDNGAPPTPMGRGRI